MKKIFYIIGAIFLLCFTMYAQARHLLIYEPEKYLGLY